MKHFISSLSVLCANTPPCEGRVSSRKILSLLLIFFLSIGNVWAQTVTWENATSIAAGDVVALVCESKKMELNGISTTTTKYGIGEAYTSAPVGKYELTVEEGSSTGTFSFKNGTTYLYWTSGSSLATNATKNAKTSWTVTFSNGNAIIKNANTPARQLQWNASSPRFACYDNSGQTAVQLYKKVTSDDVIVKTLKSIEVTPKTINYETGDVFKFDGTCTATYSVTKNDEPQADETAVVTPTTVSTPDMNQVGTQTITVSYTEDGNTVTTTYDINVTENVVTPGTYTGNLNNTFFGCAVGNNATEQSGKFNDVLVVAGCKSSASSKTNYQSGHVRFYADSYLTLSVPVGYVIKSIVFTADGTWNGSITASAGTYDNNSKTWTGNAQEVKFSFAQQNRIKSVKVTYAADVKYALTITEPAAGTGTLVVKDGENELTSGAEIYEGTKLTVTATPETGYEDGVVVVKNASDEDVTATVYADGVLTMPAYAVTISATFEEKPCELLAKPTVSATTTYSSATLTWEAVANAAKYSVTVGETTTEVTEPTYTATGLNAETTYTYQVQAIAEADQDTYCDSEVAEGSFTTTAAPVATLTLKDIVGTTTLTGSLNGTITLPTIAAECSKTFVGWSAVEILEPGEKPATNFYARGAEYTLAAETQTLYAVYADGEGGGTVTITPTKGTEETKACTFNLDQDGYTLSASGGGSNPVYNETNSDARIYAGGILTLTATKAMNTIVIKLSAQGKKRLAPITVSTGTIATQAVNDATVTWTGNATEVVFTVGDKANFGSDGETKAGQLCFSTIEVTHSSEYSNYSTTCAAAPIATVNPTSVTATAAGVNGTLEVSYENVNTANVAVALYNDAACTETFTAGWLTATLDGDKNVTYTVAENTTYAERKAYIKLTAPETTGATEPDVVVIPVTQAGKDKVFASLAELVAADLTEGDEVTVTLNNDVIKDFYIYSSKRCGVVFDVQKGGKDIKIYFNNQTTIVDWAVGGKLSGTLTNVKWTTYSSAWQLAPANTWAWANLTYTEPKAVSTVVVSGAPTKTTYVDGEAFDPAGLTVTVNYNDATTEVNPTGVTFTVTPATLTKGETAVSVTATYNSVSSAAYEVTGLTVNDIPTKTVAEFIAAGGTRCYLEGIVSGLTEGNSMKYGNFDLTDASGTIYVYGCLNAAGESQKFAELGVKNGDKIKVIADEYELYNGTTEEAKNVQYVSHISAATITIADITMEVGETKTIAATVVPAEATVTYTIKENAANAISLSGNVITANAVGTATITATIATTADYMGKTVDFTVNVTPESTSDEVVILAQYNGEWYAMTNVCTENKQMGALKVNYVNGVILDFAGDKASITWTRTVVGDKVTFANNGKYLVGGASTTLNYTSNTFEWDVVDGKYLSDAKTRTFLFQGSYFKNYAISNAGKTYNGTTYSAMPVVAAVEFMNSVATPSVEKGIFSVADGEFVQFSTGNLQYEVGTNTWSFASEQYDYVGEANINVGDPSYTGKIDMFGWSADGKFGVNPSNKNEDYYGTFQDWGTLVDEADWYTLSADEWKYLLNTRANAANLKQIAKVGSVVGIMLFPDVWTMPKDVNVTAEYDSYFEVKIYNYTLEQWEKLETVGAVFLPAAGRRAGGYGNMINKDQVEETNSENLNGGHYKHQDNTNIYCYYWTSTINESKDVSYLHNIQALGGDEYTIGTGAIWAEKGRYGQSVRLVKEVTPDYTRDVRQGYYGTICLENGGQMIGASLFGLSYYNEAQGLLYMDEVGTTTMTAGNPYIFLPNEGADKLYVFYDETTSDVALTVNGLVGSFDEDELPVSETDPVYIMKDNKIKKVVGANVFVSKNRAYIQLGSVDKNEPARVPGRRRVAIGQAPQVATGMESVDASAQPVKMIIDGQLYILRGEKMYDAQGKLVK